MKTLIKFFDGPLIKNSYGPYNGFAIEPEIESPFAFQLKQKHPIMYENCNGRGMPAHISEIRNMHNFFLNKKRKKEGKNILKKIWRRYQDGFPLGQDGFTSGGVHFHIFLEKDVYEKLFGKLVTVYVGDGRSTALNCYTKSLFNRREISTYFLDNVAGVPLFCKKSGNNIYSRRRYCSSSSSLDTKRIRFNEHENRNYKFQYSLEFRMNNVFDFRIAGLYLGLTYLAMKNIGLQVPEKINEYLEKGESFYEKHWKTRIVKFSELKGCTLTEEDYESIDQNMQKIFNVLEETQTQKIFEKSEKFLC
jgi:hypothetical protein